MSRKERLLMALASVVVVGLGLCLAVQRADAVIDIFWWLRR